MSTNQLIELERDECLRLLAVTRLGRVAVSARERTMPPVIRPINYVFDEHSQSVIFRSARGSKFTALLLSGRAAFEVDGIELADESGWSVIIHGNVEEVTNRQELDRLEQLGLHSWAPGDKPHCLRIRATVVSGRRIPR